MPLLSYVFSCDHHMIIVESVPESVLDHAVDERTVVHTITEARLIESEGGERHIFHTACYNDISVACLDEISSHIHGVKTGAADHIQCDGRNRNGKTRVK